MTKPIKVSSAALASMPAVPDEVPPKKRIAAKKTGVKPPAVDTTTVEAMAAMTLATTRAAETLQAVGKAVGELKDRGNVRLVVSRGKDGLISHLDIIAKPQG